MPSAIGMITDVATPEELEKLVIEEHRERLLQIAADYSDTGVKLNAVVRIGKPPVEIVREVLERKHDLVVKTASENSALNRLFGSTGQTLMRTCPCPVWMLKPSVHGPFDRVLVAIDLEAQDANHETLNRTMLDIANSIAIRDHAALHIVSAWDMWMEQSLRRRAGDAEVEALSRSREQRVHGLLDQLLKDLAIDIPQAQKHLHQGTADRVILQVAEQMEADLLVLGTVCRTGVAGFLIGNTAEQVLADATCSVLTLKPEGFVTPIRLTDEEPNENVQRPADLPFV